jgi:hypothetical protein
MLLFLLQVTEEEKLLADNFEFLIVALGVILLIIILAYILLTSRQE